MGERPKIVQKPGAPAQAPCRFDPGGSTISVIPRWAPRDKTQVPVDPFLGFFTCPAMRTSPFVQLRRSHIEPVLNGSTERISASNSGMFLGEIDGGEVPAEKPARVFR